jgi:hypothetical protein
MVLYMRKLNLALVILILILYFGAKPLESFFVSVFRLNNETNNHQLTEKFNTETTELTNIDSNLIKPLDKLVNDKKSFECNKHAFHSLNQLLLGRNSNFYKILKTDRCSIFTNQDWGSALTLYQPGQERILIVRRDTNKLQRIKDLVNSVKKHPRFFKVFNAGKGVSIQYDSIVNEPNQIDFYKQNQSALNDDRFEMGIDGLRLVDKINTKYFLPGDAFVKSVLSMNQLERYLKRLTNNEDLNNLKIQKFNSISLLFKDDSIIPLYRGYPLKTEVTKSEIQTIAANGADYLFKHQDSNGQFLYYYDARSDSYLDHEHPNLGNKRNAYYNMLRHNGGVLLLLHEYERAGNPKLIDAAKKALDFLKKQLIKYDVNGEGAYYLYYNKKSKLGGAGTALYALIEYQRLSNDLDYEEEIHGLARHLLEQIQDSGEFIYYSIYLDQKVTPEMNKNLFNFYYPGEALCGLVYYYKNYMIDGNKSKDLFKQKIKKAYDFLVDVRPITYKQYFRDLPSDSWLMMSILKLWDIEELREQKYADFVLNDSDLMLNHMYTNKDALYFDYPGSFYYFYGEHPYPDGARAEGFLAGYLLAKKIGDKARIQKYEPALKLMLLATSRLANIPESVYSAKNPALAIWGIRFKLTRQWFRVDTIEHVAAFYSKYLFAVGDLS